MSVSFEERLGGRPTLIRATSKTLLLLARLPSWRHPNNFIEKGYLPPTATLVTSLDLRPSKHHNETVNIFTHLIGAIAFISVGAWFLWIKGATLNLADKAVIMSYVLGTVICFSLSTIFHTCRHQSRTHHAIGLQLDYLGIVTLMCGSMIPLIYYGFYCEPQLQTLYTSLLLVLGATCALLTMNPLFQRSPLTRVFIFGSIACLSIAIVVHILTLSGWEYERYKSRIDLGAIGWTLFFNILGAGVYIGRVSAYLLPQVCSHLDFFAVFAICDLELALGVLRLWDGRLTDQIPERFSDRVAIYGSSHQVFHTMVFVAACTYLNGLLRVQAEAAGPGGSTCQ